MNKQSIITAVQAAAEATGNKNIRLAIGAPGEHVDIGTGEMLETGQAWVSVPSVFDTLIEGIADRLWHVKQVTSNYDLEATDHVVEVAANNVVVALPTLIAGFRGPYIIKALNFTGISVTGTVDGAAGPINFPAYGALRVYCNGSEWLRW